MSLFEQDDFIERLGKGGEDGVELPDRHFACTQCGACCNRPPEMELGEAAALADIFVLRLMFRLYSLPRSPSDYRKRGAGAQTSAGFYESKRLLSAFAAHSWDGKFRHGGKVAERRYTLTISVLPLNIRDGACAALDGQQCGIYGRRPLACRSVPLHYSRAPAFALADIDSFTALSDHACHTGADAPLLLSGGRIHNPDIAAARDAALRLAAADRRWKQAIVKAIKAGAADLPSLRQIEANAHLGVMTTSMRAGWQVAVSAGLMDAAECERLSTLQLALIERLAGEAALSPTARQEIAGLRQSYSNAAAGRALHL